ncbi:LacI family DNA-binding transcriptional regulator [Mucilaginibacter glaciei]|uniref:LacI family DNA-binding transcriptional regulator n=1 Tax=Mucilaginibacter glaciei TaxID=2772109 RepID=A0A926NTU4_9SPHI|nr:substrate-binding domain-containing protein [Mucilaginibacter glaciei]MBD1391663.1 LacI family DNA-binding transcriptional regulator [Mucilaginibacter glaciei]
MNKKISMDDIARDLNISKSTISFIINGKAKEMRISDKLATRVLDYVKEKNYNRNALAQSLRTGKSKIIGLIVEDIADAFFSSVARLIEERAYKKGYKIIYCSTEDNPKKTIELINMFKGRNVDGFIITAPKGIETEVELLVAQNHPFVLFDRYFPEIETDYVIIDNLAGAKMAVEHLVAEGFRQIAFITLASDQTQMAERLKGYNEAIKAAGFKPQVLEIKFTSKPEKVVQQVSAFLLKNKDVDAVLFATNYLALQGFEAINRQNLRIPDDLAVVAFDDHAFFKVFNPPITAVSQPMKNLSENLIDVLFKRMSGGEDTGSSVHKVLPPELIVRKSSVKSK